MLETRLNFKLLEMCSRCGACYSICPSCMNIPGYDPREVIRDILSGDHERWLSSRHIWECLECHYCVEICYQHYGFENAMTALRMVAAKKGMHPPQVKRGWDMFVKTGKLGEPALPARKKFGLPEPKASGGDEFRKLYALLKEKRGEAK
ncbi:MAG: 4Fe-4S dicluster domain-containing protein [Deltaproteobacteria bacterium]|nr:4Fe-4S dicluster domain-containing protein [Deltaproteobacteria bacterium]MCL4874578.1 4Fe-4S dicluster domain-containing protein [bacterium]